MAAKLGSTSVRTAHRGQLRQQGLRLPGAAHSGAGARQHAAPHLPAGARVQRCIPAAWGAAGRGDTPPAAAPTAAGRNSPPAEQQQQQQQRQQQQQQRARPSRASAPWAQQQQHAVPRALSHVYIYVAATMRRQASKPGTLIHTVRTPATGAHLQAGGGLCGRLQAAQGAHAGQQLLPHLGHHQLVISKVALRACRR